MSQDDGQLEIARRVYDLAVAFRRMRKAVLVEEDTTVYPEDPPGTYPGRYVPGSRSEHPADLTDYGRITEMRAALGDLAEHIDERRRELERVEDAASDLLREARRIERDASLSREEAKVMWSAVVDQQVVNAQVAERNRLIVRLLLVAGFLSLAGPVLTCLLSR